MPLHPTLNLAPVTRQIPVTGKESQPEHKELFILNTLSLPTKLVLYFYCDNTWKLADFGISAPSLTAGVTTAFSKGTAYYRAPELLSETPKFTNKVDLWALGC